MKHSSFRMPRWFSGSTRIGPTACATVALCIMWLCPRAGLGADGAPRDQQDAREQAIREALNST